MKFDWAFFSHYLFEPSSVFLHGLWLTLSISVLAQSIGTALGVAGALGTQSKFRAIRILVALYTWIFRGIPQLVILVYIYTGLAAANIFRFEDIDFGAFVIPGNYSAAVVAFSLTEGAYMTEIVRAAIRSVDPGQTEAAKSLGMTYFKLMRRIILPQAARVIIPPLGNEFNAMLKNTTLASVIGVQEMLLATNMQISATFRVFELLSVVSLYYLALTTLWGSVAQPWIDRRFGNNGPNAQSQLRMAGWRQLLLPRRGDTR
jgi:polar amino acid transport system permease protein